MAPTIVNISRYMANLTLAILSFTKDEAAPLDVAIITIMPQATASLTGKPNENQDGCEDAVRRQAPLATQ